MTGAAEETPQVPPEAKHTDEKQRSIHDGSRGDIVLFDDLSQKSEKLLRYPNSPIENADIGSNSGPIAQTPENEGVFPPAAPLEPVPEPASQAEFPAPLPAQPIPIEIPGSAIALIDPVRLRNSAPSPWGPLFIFFLISFSICSAGLNVYLFWQARNLGAELEKRPPAPRGAAWQKK